MGKDDVECGPFSIETKSLKAFAGRKIMAQTVRNCQKDKTPLCIVHEPGQRRDNDLVMMRLADWEVWYGDILARKGA